MPITPTLITHDFLLTDYLASPVTLGLIVEKDSQGRPKFRRQTADSLSQQQFQDISQAMFPPSIQGFITQNTWHGGFGKQTLKGLGGENQYMQTHGVDKSIKGLSYPSPPPVATTNSTASYSASGTISNGNFETGDSTGWSTFDLFTVVNTGTPHGGTYHARQQGSGGAAQLKQALTAADSSLFGAGITISIDVWTKLTAGTAHPSATIKVLGDATVLATSAELSQTGAYTKTTLTYAFTDGYPTIYIQLDASDSGDPTTTFYVDDIVVTITGSISTSTAPNAVVGMVDFNNSSYLYSDSGLWKRTAANWVRVAGSPTDIVDAASDGTNLYLARGFSKSLWYMSTSEAFTRITASNASSKLAYINGSMYSITSATNLRKYTDITAGTTAANYTIGQTGYNVTALVNHLELPYVVKENWAGYVNSSGVVIDIVSELASLYNANTGKNSRSWQGKDGQTLYIPAGAGASLRDYDIGVGIGPDMFAEQLADFNGQIVATASDDQWLYIVLDNSAKIEILKGRYEEISGVIDFRWHPIIEDTYTTVGYAFITSITTKRLYYGGGTALPKYIPLSTQYGNPLGDTGLTYNTAVTDETPWYDLNLPRISKSYLNMTIDSTGLTANITITVEYQLWESQGTWTELGGSGNGVFNSSPTQTKTFAINIAGRKIRFRFTYTTNNTATPYAMYEYTARLALAPTRLNIYTATVRVGSKNKLKNTGETDTEMVYSKVAPQLHSWSDTQPLLITFPDGQYDGPNGTHNGATEEVKFMEGYPKEIPEDLGVFTSTRKDPESLFELALVSIDRSVS